MSKPNRPKQTIVPPFILDGMAERGTPTQRASARKTLAARSRVLRKREQARRQASATPDAKNRTIYDADENSDLPGRVVRREGEPATGDAGVDEAYDGSGETWTLYWNAFSRNSLDGQGLPLILTVHFDDDPSTPEGYSNAYWDGEQMVFGDGDGETFNRFTIDPAIIGHELAHGVTQYTAGLAYFGQPGALNEALSDIFGSLVKQQILGHSPSEADWLIGEGLFTPIVNGVAIRSMKAPGTAYDDPVLGKDPQPAHMRDYVYTGQDNGGVHINSGIVNHAFYRSAMALGSTEELAQVWYKAMTEKFHRQTDFPTAASDTVLCADTLYGAASAVSDAVRSGWSAVGLEVGDGDTPPPPEPSPCTLDEMFQLVADPTGQKILLDRLVKAVRASMRDFKKAPRGKGKR